jgi:hypothetical protein
VRLEEAILKTLEKELAVRCQSAAELRADLTRVKRQASGAVAIQTTLPADSSAETKTPRPRRSANAGWRGALIGLAFAAVAGLLGKWHPWGQRQPETPPANRTELPPPNARLPVPGDAQPPADGIVIPPPPPKLPAAATPLSGGLGARADTLITLLRDAPPETYDLVFAANDPEAMTIAMQLRKALTAAGWTNASTLEIARPQAKIGIFSPRVTPGVTALTNWARRSGLAPETGRESSLKNVRIVIGEQQ